MIYALRPTPERLARGLIPTTLLDIPSCILHDVVLRFLITPRTLPMESSVKLECFADVVLSLRAWLLTCKSLLREVYADTWFQAFCLNQVRVQASWNLTRKDFIVYHIFIRNIKERRAVNNCTPQWAVPNNKVAERVRLDVTRPTQAGVPRTGRREKTMPEPSPVSHTPMLTGMRTLSRSVRTDRSRHSLPPRHCARDQPKRAPALAAVVQGITAR